MTFRKPLLAVPIILAALLVLLIASAPAQASGEMVTLEITHVGSQGEVECSVDKGVTFEECEPEEEFEKGTEIVLHGNPAPTVDFLGFGNGTGSAAGCKGAGDCTFVIETNSTVEATFVPMVKLEVHVEGQGEAECEEVETEHIGPCSSEYPIGTKLTIEGDPEEHWMFKEFGTSTGSAAACASETLCTFTLNEESSVTLVFVPKPKYPLKVNTWGKGTVISSPAGISCPGACTDEFEEGFVELVATPESGYEFVGWIGCSEGEPKCELNLAGPTEVTAVFLKVAKEGEKGKEGKEGKEGEKGKEGKEGKEGKQGNEGPEGPKGDEGLPGAAGIPGIEGEEGSRGAPGLQGPEGPGGPSGQTGPAGSQGPAGAAGPSGPAGAAGAPGTIELVTCTVVKKKGKNVRECKTKVVTGTVKFTATAAFAHAALRRHGVVFAVGFAARRHGKVRLRLAALHRLRPGRYKLTIGTGKTRHAETVTLG